MKPKHIAALRKLAREAGLSEGEWIERAVECASAAHKSTPKDVSAMLSRAGIRFTIVCENPSEAWSLITGVIKSRPDEPIPLDLVKALRGES